MQFQHMARRSKLLINQTFSLRIETQAEQLRFVLDRVQSMSDQHSEIESGTCRVRVMNFVGAAYQLDLLAYGKTGDWAYFTAVRQDVILKRCDTEDRGSRRGLRLHFRGGPTAPVGSRSGAVRVVYPAGKPGSNRGYLNACCPGNRVGRPRPDRDVFPAVNGYFFLPTYPTMLAAISFDQTGTTRVGKYVLNHSFMLPGMVATISSVSIGFLLAKVVF
jgi:hypothetical protein